MSGDPGGPKGTGARGGARERARDLALAVGASLAVVAAAFLPVLAGRRSFFSFDLLYEHLPIWTWVRDALRAGHSPFWIDALATGHPLLFHQEAPLFYPATLPLLLLSGSVSRAADLFSLLHFVLAGVTAFLLARELTGDRTAGLFAAVGWALSARTVQGVAWPPALAVAALVPAILLGLVRMASARASGVAWTAAALGLALLSCRPQSVLAASPVLAAMAGGALFLATDRRRFLASLALAASLGAALGAPGVLPTLLYLPEMDRFGGLSPSSRDEGALRVGDLGLLALPAADPGRSIETAAYPGLAAVGLLACGILLPDRRSRAGRTWFACLAVGGLIGALLALGSAGPYGWISDAPLLRGLRAPGRFLLSYSAAVVFGAALVLARLRRTSRAGSLLSWSLVLFLAADLVRDARRSAPTVPAALFAVRPALADALSRVPRDPLGFPRRYWSAGLLPPLHALPDDLRLAAMERDHLNNASGLRFGLQTVQGAGPLLSLTARLFAEPGLAAARMAGAGRLVLRAPVPGLDRLDPDAPDLPQAATYIVPGPLSRAVLVRKSQRAPEGQALAAVLAPGFDPSGSVVLEDAEPLSPVAPSSGTPPGDVAPDQNPASILPAGTTRPAEAIEAIRQEPSHLEFEVRAPADGLLVLFDAFASGWGATVDGKPAQLFLADSCFRAVRVPAGPHRVRFDYSPPGLFPAIALAALGALGIALSVRREASARNSPGSPDAGAA